MPDNVQITIQDISRQLLSIQKKAALSDVVPYLVEIFDMQPSAFWITDLKFKIKYANQKILDLIDCSFSEFFNFSLFNFIIEQDRIKLLNIFSNLEELYALQKIELTFLDGNENHQTIQVQYQRLLGSEFICFYGLKKIN